MKVLSAEVAPEVIQVADALRVGIIVVGSDLRISLMNPAARAMLRVKADPIGKLALSVSRNMRLGDALRAAVTEGITVADHITVTHRGKDKEYGCRVAPFVGSFPQQAVVGAFAIIDDITELKRLEQVRSDFAANVSHELKTPLTSIHGFIETLMSDGVDRAAQMRFLKIIQFETERLARLIDDILSLSSLEFRPDEADLVPLEIDPVLQRSINILRPRAEERDIALRYSVEGTPMLMGQPDRVQQMVLNIAENAIKYSHEGGHVEVRAFSAEDRIVIEVEDDGIGMSPEHQARLFERFYRVDRGRSRAMGGTGLGLAIVKHIVRAMNGEIDVTSELGRGSVFRMRFPRIDSPAGKGA